MGTASATFEVQSVLKEVKGPVLLRNTLIKKVTVEEFKLNFYLQRQIKSCKIPYNMNANIITCPSRGATQKTKSSKLVCLLVSFTSTA